MKATLTLDAAGRIVIPKSVRDALRLSPGDAIALESIGDSLVLRPARSGAPLKKERGIWVLEAGGTLSTDDTNRALEALRNERERRMGGPSE